MTQWLEFKEVKQEKKKKTKVFAVFNKKTGDFLGTVLWKGAWGQYIFDDGVLEIGKSCMMQLVDLFDELNKERLSK